ncbi:MAG: flavin reductase, partial [Parvularculaceae bacterium]
LSDRYAGFLPNGVHMADFETGAGAPLLKDRLAGFDCKVAARHEAGDHVILIGEVRRFDSVKGAPLIYYASQYIPGTEKLT